MVLGESASDADVEVGHGDMLAMMGGVLKDAWASAIRL